MLNSPCMNCKERKPACHDRCERYKAYKEERTMIWRYRKRFKTPDNSMAELKCNLYEKYRKKRGGRT